MTAEWEIGGLQSGRIPATGERFLPWMEDDRIAHEHLHRYLFASSLARGASVLDVGSGEGYGSALLGRSAARVLGIERDPVAVESASARYGSPGIEFVVGDCLDVDQVVGDDTFDIVTCFELIEHVEDQHRVLTGIRRCLKHDGLAIVSTPNRPVHRARSPGPNAFHVRELDTDEFVALLHAVFEHVAVWAQSSVRGSELISLSGSSGVPADQRFEVARSAGGWGAAAAPPEYIVGCVSRKPIEVAVRRSYLVDRSLAAPRAPSAPSEAEREGGSSVRRRLRAAIWSPGAHAVRGVRRLRLHANRGPM